ncbi:hypothetical protein ACJX0J_013972, partial [Zea mays]
MHRAYFFMQTIKEGGTNNKYAVNIENKKNTTYLHHSFLFCSNPNIFLHPNLLEEKNIFQLRFNRPVQLVVSIQSPCALVSGHIGLCDHTDVICIVRIVVM